MESKIHYHVEIGTSVFHVDASNSKDAKLKGARAYVRKYHAANLDVQKVQRLYKIKAHRLGESYEKDNG